MDILLQDLRYAWRTLWRSPGFSIVAILTLALGIGANTSMFSVVNAVLLRRLPFNDPDRVLAVSQKMANGSINIFSTPDFLAWKEQGGAAAEMAATATTSFNLSKDESSPERVSGERVSYNLFPVLGVRPMLGRPFTADEDRPGAAPVVVLSHALWKTRFSANPEVVGKLIVLDGKTYTIIGVMPEGFHVYRDDELVWAALQLQTSDTAASSRNVHWLRGIGRLAPHESLSQTQVRLDAIAARVHRQDSSADVRFGISLQPLGEALVGDVRPALLILSACVGCLLLIACSNVANLLLARATARRREISIRIALGAPRKRIARQVLIESLLVSIFGGMVALVLAFLAIKILVHINAPNIPDPTKVGIDEWTLGYTLLTCILVALLFGTIPALIASRVEVNESLKDATGTLSGGFGKHRAAFVITEMALASALLIGAGLLLKSAWLLRNVDPGFNPEKVLTFRLAAPARVQGDRVPAFYERILDALRTLPGVQSAALGRDLPMSGTDPSMPVNVDGAATNLAPGQIVTRFRAVGPQYFHTLQIPLLHGREFTDNDTRASLPVALISESLARLYWPNQDAIGKRLQPRFANAPWYTVVGVVSDVRHWGLDVAAEPTAYYDYAQVPDSLLPMVENYMSIAVRSSGDLAGLLPALRSATASVDKTVPIYDTKTMTSMLSDSGSQRHFDVDLLGTFAGLALMLAGIGVYGVMAYSVSRRTREIGIRMAIGASRRDVLRLVVAQGAKLAGVGVGLGIFGALLCARWMASILYGVKPTDLFTFSVVPIFMFACMLSASYLPAARASRIDPLVALRCE